MAKHLLSRYLYLYNKISRRQEATANFDKIIEFWVEILIRSNT